MKNNHVIFFKESICYLLALAEYIDYKPSLHKFFWIQFCLLNTFMLSYELDFRMSFNQI